MELTFGIWLIARGFASTATVRSRTSTCLTLRRPARNQVCLDDLDGFAVRGVSSFRLVTHVPTRGDLEE